MGLLQPHGRHRRGDGEAALIHSFMVRDAREERAPHHEGKTSSPDERSALTEGAAHCAASRRMAARKSPMTKSFRTLDDVDVKGKRVLLRVDLNVPMDNGRVTDATRLERVAPTITEISEKGGKVILLAHFGRPKGRDAKDSLKPVAADLAEVIKKPVAFADDCIGEAAAKAVAAMKDGDILCLENTRFHKEEEK